eukprot:139816-Pyramimonas_sp.AAC.1
MRRENDFTKSEIPLRQILREDAPAAQPGRPGRYREDESLHGPQLEEQIGSPPVRAETMGVRHARLHGHLHGGGLGLLRHEEGQRGRPAHPSPSLGPEAGEHAFSEATAPLSGVSDGDGGTGPIRRDHRGPGLAVNVGRRARLFSQMQELQRAVAVHGVRGRDDPPALEGAQAPGQGGPEGPERGPLPVPGGDADGLQLVTRDLS